MINLEKAWDIQPQAGSTITSPSSIPAWPIKNATLTATLPAFTDEDGVRYPALGRVTIPYSAAPRSSSRPGSSRIVAPHDFI